MDNLEERDKSLGYTISRVNQGKIENKNNSANKDTESVKKINK